LRLETSAISFLFPAWFLSSPLFYLECGLMVLSVEAAERDFQRRFALNHALVDNAYWRYPVDDRGHENCMPTGRGQVTNSHCGRWKAYRVCDHVELHAGFVSGGVDYTGKLVVMHEHYWCHKASCPICFARGWAAREARAIDARLKFASKRGYGEVEHIMVSVPKADYGLSLEVLREKCRVAMARRGVLGGAMMPHGFRIDRKRKVLVWGVHFHALGFVAGGFDVCRECVHERGDCAECSCFKGREVREYAKDGYLVKVLPKRKTVIGTAWYQLNHCTLKVGLKRNNVVTYFGVCGCSKLKGSALSKSLVSFECPACGNDAPRRIYWAKEPICKDIGSPLYKKVFPMEEFGSSGLPNFANAGGGKVE